MPQRVCSRCVGAAIGGIVDLDEKRVAEALGTVTFGCNLSILRQVGSTNDVMRDLARQGAPEGMVVVAEEQTVGRGRMGRRWEAPAGACLLCSVLFRPQLPPDRSNQLTMLVSLAMADAVALISGLTVALKWPNDLVVPIWGDEGRPDEWRKLAGVLTESAVSAETVDHVVVGIGINVNVPAEGLQELAPDATSILAETGRHVSREELLVVFLREVERRYRALGTGHGLQGEWIARLATLGQQVDVIASSARFTGWAEAVDADGALLLRTPDGQLHRLMAGDVTLAHSSDWHPV